VSDGPIGSAFALERQWLNRPNVSGLSIPLTGPSPRLKGANNSGRKQLVRCELSSKTREMSVDDSLVAIERGFGNQPKPGVTVQVVGDSYV
jgi:hypothetical protein